MQLLHLYGTLNFESYEACDHLASIVAKSGKLKELWIKHQSSNRRVIGVELKEGKVRVYDLITGQTICER